MAAAGAAACGSSEASDWILVRDGRLRCDEEGLRSLSYHPALNAILAVTSRGSIKVIDGTSGAILQASVLHGEIYFIVMSLSGGYADLIWGPFFLLCVVSSHAKRANTALSPTQCELCPQRRTGKPLGHYIGRSGRGYSSCATERTI